MICIFNPDHDLCLANGSSNYLPPESALRFADECAEIMHLLYPDANRCCSVRQLRASGASEDSRIVPWGWNRVVKSQLLKCGVGEALLPSDQTLEAYRQMQHRSTILPLQPQNLAATTIDEVEAMIRQHRAVVLKAPWSGSGRGLRWVTDAMSPHDVSWFQKVVRQQRCVIVEPRHTVESEFALEYHISPDGLTFCGFSYFTSTNGVYRANLLLADDDIRQKVSFSHAEQLTVELWLKDTVVGHYEGPLGIDYLHTQEGQNILSEFNFRHTMGMVAHAYLQQHPECEGEEWVLTP